MKLIFAAVTILFFASCDTPRYAYSPNAHNVPVLVKQGDSKVAAAYSTNAVVGGNLAGNDNSQYDRARSNGYDLQGAVAVTNHIGLQANYFLRKEKSFGDNYTSFDSSVVRYKRNLYEFGAGYYTSISRKQKVFFQAFAGIGFGKLSIAEVGDDSGNPYSRFYRSDIRKYYIEPAILFRNKETFAASVSTRLSIINFKNVRNNYTQNEKEIFRLDSLNRYAILFFEPAVVNSWGFNKLPGFRIEYQFGLCMSLDPDGIINYRPFNFSVGLAFDIAKLIKGPANKNKD